MVDALAAVGLASAIVQFIDYATKIINRLADFGAALDQVPKAFKQIKTELPLIIDGVRRIKDQAESCKLNKSTEDALQAVIHECQVETERLNDILEKTIPTVGASSWERRKKAITSLAKDKKVEEIADALGKYVRTLTFHQTIEGGLRSEALPTPKPKVFWLVPFDRNPSFVGRDGTFKEIDETFKVKEGSQPKAALCGLGGIG
jgi:uncharacterized protein YutE (UPF0331/DUF86 family)